MTYTEFKSRLLMLGIVPAVVASLSFAQTEGNGTAWERESIKAEVVSIMPAEGLVVVKDGDRVYTLKADQNLDLTNLKDGDDVTVDIYHARALEFTKPRAADRQNPLTMQGSVAPPQGVIPMAGQLRRVRALVTIEHVSNSRNALTFSAPDGRTYTAKVDDPSILDSLKDDQEWVVVFTDGIVASLQRR